MVEFGTMGYLMVLGDKKNKLNMNKKLTVKIESRLLDDFTSMMDRKSINISSFIEGIISEELNKCRGASEAVPYHQSRNEIGATRENGLANSHPDSDCDRL